MAAAYSDDEEAAGDFAALKEDLPKVGRLVDRSKVILLATSDAPNEVDVEHIGGGPIGKLVEVGGRARPQGPARSGERGDRRGGRSRRRERSLRGARARAGSRGGRRLRRGRGDEQKGKEAVQAAVGMAMAQVMEQWVHPTASAAAIRSLAAANEAASS